MILEKVWGDVDIIVAPANTPAMCPLVNQPFPSQQCFPSTKPGAPSPYFVASHDVHRYTFALRFCKKTESLRFSEPFYRIPLFGSPTYDHPARNAKPQTTKAYCHKTVCMSCFRKHIGVYPPAHMALRFRQSHAKAPGWISIIDGRISYGKTRDCSVSLIA